MINNLDKSQKKRILKLYALFTAGKIPGPIEHEVHPDLNKGSRENYLYFTLPCALNFQRNSPALWRSALNTYNDASTNYLFFPELVIKTDPIKVSEDLRKHKLAIQTNKHPKIWIALCTTLATYYSNDPREILQESNFDIQKIIQKVQVDQKPLFPFLGGIKLSNYWLFILTCFTDVRFINLHNLSIIPDTHVIKSSIYLKVVPENASAKEVETAWRNILKVVKISPTEMHSALWRWSRENFKPEI